MYRNRDVVGMMEVERVLFLLSTVRLFDRRGEWVNCGSAGRSPQTDIDVTPTFERYNATIAIFPMLIVDRGFLDEHVRSVVSIHCRSIVSDALVKGKNAVQLLPNLLLEQGVRGRRALHSSTFCTE